MKKFIGASAVLAGFLGVVSAQNWVDISTALINTPAGHQTGTNSWEIGTSGNSVNRLTGAISIHISGNGIHRSTDKGATWTRIDQNKVDNTFAGRCESGWAVQTDQENPTRVAVFNLDGDAAYTPDGITWKKLTSVWGRNWDFGSVDWNDPQAKVLLAGAHESGGIVWRSTNGGTSWVQVTGITMNPAANMDVCMLGVIDSTTFIYCYGNGIQRSTNSGATWTQVSTLQPRSKVPVRFKGKYYLGTSGGMICSADKGLTWQVQGAIIDMWDGPFFGSSENVIAAAGPLGVFRSNNGGTTWTKVTDPHPSMTSGFNSTKWWGSYTWDPIHNIVYSTSMGLPSYKKELTVMPDPGTSSAANAVASIASKNTLQITNSVLSSSTPFNNFSMFSISGKLLYSWHGACTKSFVLPNHPIGHSSLICQISSNGNGKQQVIMQGE